MFPYCGHRAQTCARWQSSRPVGQMSGLQNKYVIFASAETVPVSPFLGDGTATKDLEKQKVLSPVTISEKRPICQSIFLHG